ncbi:MAG: hypothetical protein GH159_00025 [Dehalococcoidia bacterium]|nr:hypothetical protein [Dehalococcoidia bacterium]
MSQSLVEQEGFWNRGLGIAIKYYIIIYGLTILTCFIVNLWMKAAPIGPDKLYWFDNVCWMVISLLWCFVFAAVGNWPFSLIKGKIVPGIVAVISCWILGYFTYAGIYWFGVTIDGVFPIAGTLFFLIVFFCYTGENWPWADFSPPRRLFLIVITLTGLTWLICRTAVVWVPAWWFPFCQFLLGAGLFAYLFRGMKQPVKSIAAWCFMGILVYIWLYISKLLGIWDPQAAGTSAFWHIGGYGDTWLLFFFVFCSFVFGILVPARNWPFRLVRQPWGGALACVFCTALSVGITVLLLNMVKWGVFPDIQMAFTYGYMGVCWSFMIPIFFQFGHEKPYLWAGQKTPGTWEDV